MRSAFSPLHRACFKAAIIMTALSLLISCGKNEQKPATQTSQAKRPSASNSSPLELVKGVEQGKWKAVKIGITDRQQNRDLICSVDIGTSVAIPDSGLTIKVHNFLPHFQMQGRKVLSLSNKLKNPAAFVTITDNTGGTNGKPLELKGYLFSRYPNTALNHPRYKFVLMDFVPMP